MKKSRFSEEKIISILKQLEAGAKATELARKYGVSDVIIYNWKGRGAPGQMSMIHRKESRIAKDHRSRFQQASGATGAQSYDGCLPPSALSCPCVEPPCISG